MFRPLASLAILGAVFFLAFFAYLLFNLVDGHFLSADFYSEALAEQNVYARLYDEVLVDPALEDESKELLGNLDVPQNEMAGLARNIMPPEYLQGETERTLHNLIGYLKKDVDELELYINLGGPLDNASVGVGEVRRGPHRPDRSRRSWRGDGNGRRTGCRRPIGPNGLRRRRHTNRRGRGLTAGHGSPAGRRPHPARTGDTGDR